MTIVLRRLAFVAALAAMALAAGSRVVAQRINRADDKTAPTVKVVSPAAGARVESAVPDIEIAYDDAASGVSVVTFKARINDRDFSRAFEHHSRGATAKITRRSWHRLRGCP